MPISLHSHSGQFCKHAVGTLESVVEAAIGRGFISYGLSEHMPRDRIVDLYPEEHHINPSELEEQFDRFILEASRLKRAHSSTISLLIGIETELINRSITFDLLDRTLSRHQDSLDYLVGSVHHVNEIPIDFDPNIFQQALQSLQSPHDPNDPQKSPDPQSPELLYRLCETYFDNQYDLIDRYRPEVIGHFDLCLLFNPDLELANQPAVWAKLERNIRLAISYGALFEVNSASIRKGWATPYPSPSILKLIISLDGRLTLSDDSHGPDRVGSNYHRTLEYLKSHHVQSLWYLVPAADESVSVLLPRKKVSAVKIPGDWWDHPFWSNFRSPSSSDPVAMNIYSDDPPKTSRDHSSSHSQHSVQLAELRGSQNETDRRKHNNDKFRWKNFPIERFINSKWFVVSSSLPLWKNKKNVTISYSSIDGEPINVFDDLIEYHGSLSNDPKSMKKKIAGIDRPKVQAGIQQDDGCQAIEWIWRGKGILGVLKSEWQILGYHLPVLHDDSLNKDQEPDWAIIFFRQTIFTPAGIDIYFRDTSNIKLGLKDRLIDAVRSHPSPKVASLAKSMFDIPHDL